MTASHAPTRAFTPALAAQAGLSLFAIAYVLALAAPPETCVSLGPIRLSIYRVIALMAFLPCLASLLSQKFDAVRACDFFAFFHGIWAWIALIHSEGIAQGNQSGGIYFVESFGGYLLARTFVTDLARFRTMVKIMAGIVLAMLVFTIIEALTGQHLIRETARAVLGGPGLPIIEKRMGLSRAFGSFEHPILYGIFCASAMGLAAYAIPDKTPATRILRTGLLLLATFVSVSAGALAAAAAQIALMCWDRGMRFIPSRWLVLIVLFLAICLGISAGSNRSPVKVFLTYMTFSPGTGYNRLAIWDFGSAEAMRHPILGIGLGDWIRPSYMSASMDNFWLCTAVRYGIPALAALVLTIAAIAVPIARSRKLSLEVQACRTGWIITIVGVSLAGCTVHFWNALFALFFFLIGCGAWMLKEAESTASLASPKLPVPSAKPLTLASPAQIRTALAKGSGR